MRHHLDETYRDPGWHFFRDVKSSTRYEGDVETVFRLEKFDTRKLYMKLFIPGFPEREYTSVQAPPTFQAPTAYSDVPTPTLVIRKHGEAWDGPFVAVYEPYADGLERGSVQEVEKLEKSGVFRGLKIVSRVDGKTITQYLVSQAHDGVFSDSESGLSFEGSFALITLTDDQRPRDMYLGHGLRLECQGNRIERERVGGTYLDLSGENAPCVSNGAACLSLAD
ncbi:MAG: hypothetical protein AAGD07_09985 [Planctomycetota bacterium]